MTTERCAVCGKPAPYGYWVIQRPDGTLRQLCPEEGPETPGLVLVGSECYRSVQKPAP